MRTLDRTDRMILDVLQNEGRISISELASRVHLSTTPCSERVKRLERDGIITGYHAHLNPDLVESGMLVFLEIKLSAKSGDLFDSVAQDLLKVPQIQECHLISGDFDYLVKARLKEISAYRRLLGDILKRLPASASSRSYIVMEEVKETTYLQVLR
ncbi:winged helix-turn-helix transcriptional regulator [Acinetobacter baumannii]|uniref:winged helix-turn-helix transcriptional regulator n=1 Tax=Acinetobacter baumannii TaxID=470 RepID=UPI0024488DE2|nr:winged helix-turn-helix transcriptional regulator [Acinetobacter baumannii]MDH2528307.1 winged helix-turn-helix transcriptional regulator [Acinetobacter baumannii]